MSVLAARSIGRSAADKELGEILKEISVPLDVMAEARKRRDLVLELALQHEAARAVFPSGSIAHGTENQPLEDADCGVKVDRRFEAFRAFGPDAPGTGQGPEDFVQSFAHFIAPRVREAGYPDAYLDLDGNRAIKFEFNQVVEIDDWGEVDPFVELIVGLARGDGRGLWIPNRRAGWWDPADPEHHTWLMTERDKAMLRVLRAHLIRLAKRAIKRDDQVAGQTKVMHSWNISALALDLVKEPGSLAIGLRDFLAGAAESIAVSLTDDPSPVVTDPLPLPDGVSREQAASRLHQMAAAVDSAIQAQSRAGARNALSALYGREIEAMRARESGQMIRGLRGDQASLAGALGATRAPKPTYSGGA